MGVSIVAAKVGELKFFVSLAWSVVSYVYFMRKVFTRIAINAEH